MMETGPDVAPSEEAEREQLYTLLANLGASIAALTPVAAGDEDVCLILQAMQERRKLVQAQLSALRPLKTRLRAAHEAHEKANKKYKALVEEEESVMALLVLSFFIKKMRKERKCAAVLFTDIKVAFYSVFSEIALGGLLSRHEGVAFRQSRVEWPNQTGFP